MDKIVSFNVGGRIFSVRKEFIDKYPTTFLYILVNNKEALKIPFENGTMTAFFIDRNPDLFSFILEYYRKGKIVYPRIVNKEDFDEELDFYLIKEADPDDEILTTLMVNFVKRKCELTKRSYNRDKMGSSIDPKTNVFYMIDNLITNYIGYYYGHHYFVFPSDQELRESYSKFLSKHLDTQITLETFTYSKEDIYVNQNTTIRISPQIAKDKDNMLEDGSLYLAYV